MPLRLSASVPTNHDPQPSNPNQVMVIMFSVALGTVDEAHRHLAGVYVVRPCLKSSSRSSQSSSTSER